MLDLPAHTTSSATHSADWIQMLNLLALLLLTVPSLRLLKHIGKCELGLVVAVSDNLLDSLEGSFCAPLWFGGPYIK
jgi:hypothetical protein